MKVFKLVFIITTLLLNSYSYADIRGEFAKRPTALPPEPAAVVNFLKEDVLNARAEGLKVCFPGQIITVDLNDLGSTPTFFEAIDRALVNGGLSTFTSRDFLPDQPDGITVGNLPSTPNSNLYYSLDNIEIDPASTSIAFQFQNTSAISTCLNTQCAVLSSCGLTVNAKEVASTFQIAPFRIGGCLATATSPTELSQISSQVSQRVVIDALVNEIPRFNSYFLNPSKLASGATYAVLATSTQGGLIGCPSTSFQTTNGNGNICLPGSTGTAGALFSINTPSSGTDVLTTPPRQTNILGFKIKKCPTL